VTIFKDDQWTSTLLSNIHKGDRLKIRNGELIPADAIVFNGDAYIDYSFVTGESVPVHKVLGEIVYGGGRQLGGAIEVEILKEVSQSQLTKIWNSQGDNLNQSRLTSFSELISKYFTIALIAIAFITLIVWSFIDLSIGFFAFTSVLIVACPCALALSSPLALGNTLRLLGSRGFYLKNAQVVEQLARVNHIVFDKTGTLTTPQEFEVQYVGDFANDIFFSAVTAEP
jgi:Cu+-exporting ATPase